MRLNGVLEGQPVVKKRRGRRKNVEGMDLLFMNRNRVPAVPDQVNRFLLAIVFCKIRSLCGLMQVYGP